MRKPTLFAVFLSCLATTSAVQLAELLRFSSLTTTLPSATPGSIPATDAPAPTQRLAAAAPANLDLRQVPGVAPAVPVDPAAPANLVAPAVPPNPAADPGVAIAGNVAPSPTPVVPLDCTGRCESLTVHWVETWIGNTFQTWVPKTITMHLGVTSMHVAQPGKGEIGMGTLTGEVGTTKTIAVGEGSRPTGNAWVFAAVGAGVGVLGVV